MRWLNRDPIEEEGGGNVYVFENNTTLSAFDYLGMSFGMVGPNTGSTVYTYGGASVPYSADVWFAVYGDTGFSVRRRMEKKYCDCDTGEKETTPPVFDYFSVPRGGMVFVRNYDSRSDLPPQWKGMSYAELISIPCGDLYEQRGTVEFLIQITDSTAAPSTIELFTPKGQGFGTEDIHPYGDKSTEHPIRNFKVPSSEWRPKNILAEVSFTVVLTCGEPPKLKEAPRKKGDWRLDDQGWIRAVGYGNVPRERGTAMEIAP